MDGKAESVYDEIYGIFRDKQRMVWDGRWKLIHYPQICRFQLFDLDTDPFEKHDLIDNPGYRDTQVSLKAKLAKKFQEWESAQAQ